MMTEKPCDIHFEDLRLGAPPSMPLHQQIAHGLTRRIASGALSAGARLPSSRDLASQLGVSRATVELAYGTLAAEGYVARRPAAGTRVLSRGKEASQYLLGGSSAPPLMP